MGVKNYLIDGVSCAGKTAVCDELQRRGYQVIHGDEGLAYWGDLKTGEPVGGSDEHRTWIWDVEKVRAWVADQNHEATFFCGGSRNLDRSLAPFAAALFLSAAAAARTPPPSAPAPPAPGGPAPDMSASVQ